MRALVTGFGPFNGVPENPSAELARLSGQRFEVLEVSYEAAEQFVNRLDPSSFDHWLMLGVAASRKLLSMELFARNARGGEDVRGVKSESEIEKGGPLLLEASLWKPDLVADLLQSDPDRIQTSMDAGAYLCNFLSYVGLRRFPEKSLGFLHVVLPGEIPLEAQAAVVKRVLDCL